MAHDHQSVSHGARNIKLAFFLNLIFAVFELIGGLFINSLAIISDALHDLGDSISLGLAWGLEKISEKGATSQFTYGYRRVSLLAALINTIILIVGSLIILSYAVPRILEPEPTHATGMLLFAIIGICVNGYAALRVSKGHSMNEKVVTWHLLEDVIGWVAILIVGIILMVKDLYILDPILSVIITLYVLFNVLINLKKTLLLFLQGVPANIDLIQVEEKLRSIDKVISNHHTHIWSLDGSDNVLTTHLVVEPTISRDEIKEIKSQVRTIAQNLSVKHATVDLEFDGDSCIIQKVSSENF